MKQMIALLVAALAAAALIVSELTEAEAPVGPDAIVYFIADAQRELSRLPVAFTRLSDEEEVQIGDALARHYQGHFQQLQTPHVQEVAAYVEKVGASVAARARRKLPYRFHYVSSPSLVNAFALPGGHVFIGRGLVALMDSEDQLAAVLGHEIAHIDYYHCAERVQFEAALRKIPLGQLLQLPVAVFQVGYGKNQELEADREGTRLAVKSSYSPLGAIRSFEALERHYQERVEESRRADSPQEEVSRVVLETLEGYFRSHPPTAERLARIREMIASEGWENVTERNLEVGYAFWIERGRRAVEAGRFREAASLAARSLEVRPGNADALFVLAEARFALAEFQGAADAYRALLDSDPANQDWLRKYATALSAAGEPREAWRQFQEWLNANPPSAELQLAAQTDLAGLSLLAGDGGPAARLLEQVDAGPEQRQPEVQGRLGWWHYRAGDYEAAHQATAAAVRMRPQDQALQDQLGWVLIEQRDLEGAIRRMREPMGLAVANWKAHNPDAALGRFDAAVRSRPEWLNSGWVGALFAPTVVASVAEMEARRQEPKQ